MVLVQHAVVGVSVRASSGAGVAAARRGRARVVRAKMRENIVLEMGAQLCCAEDPWAIWCVFYIIVSSPSPVTSSRLFSYKHRELHHVLMAKETREFPRVGGVAVPSSVAIHAHRTNSVKCIVLRCNSHSLTSVV